MGFFFFWPSEYFLPKCTLEIHTYITYIVYSKFFTFRYLQTRFLIIKSCIPLCTCLANKKVNEDKNKNPPDSKHVIILLVCFLKIFFSVHV